MFHGRLIPLCSRATLVAAVVGFGLGGCNTLQRLSEVDSGPSTSAIVNPTQKKDYRPVSMPMPAPEVAYKNANSLWRSGSRAFFKDQRASTVGDILTVIVDIKSEKASLKNSTSSSRQGGESVGVPALAGLESSINTILPNSVDADSLAKVDSKSDTSGSGSISRSESINIRLAAVVLQVLPNGNLVIAGRQEVRVNHELRELTITGVIRPQDIGSDNTIDWDKVAEARINYGGRGIISDVQQPRYGQQIFDILFPF